MKKKLTRCLSAGLFLVSSIAFANTCPSPLNVIWKDNYWQSRDGQFWGLQEYSAGKDAQPGNFDYAFWKAGVVICGYKTNVAGKDVVLGGNDIPKPTGSGWKLTYPPGWYGNMGLICLESLVGCEF